MKARHYLAVPYAQKDEAKALGAKWDPDVKLWYADSDVSKFSQWNDADAIAIMASKRMAMSKKPKRSSPMPAPYKVHKRLVYQAKMREGFPTPRTDFSLPDCGCLHVAPWEDCEHVPAFAGIDPEAMSHLRSIMLE